MEGKRIVITQHDLDRLRRVINDAEISRTRDDLAGLKGELERARIVAPEDVPSDVVTMNSKVELIDIETDEVMEVSLVFPDDTDSVPDAVSILAPVGTAIIGYGQGDTIEWPTPSGKRAFRIQRVLFQPEAAGNWEL